MTDPQPFPARLHIDYPERRDRVSALLRAIYILPIAIVLGLISGGSGTHTHTVTTRTDGNGWAQFSEWLADLGVDTDSLPRPEGSKGGPKTVERTEYHTGRDVATGFFLATVLMLFFRRRYPRWWFDFLLAFNRFTARVVAYGLLLTDEYPSTEEEQSVHLELDYPDASKLSRGLPLVKWLLAVPHYVVLAILGFLVIPATVLGWLSILLNGTYPRPLFDYVVGVGRWALRVQAYAFLLLTDEYPPFSTQPS